ncbi:hypothetical protein GGH94_003781 [Coemansia aciculifera]|uniref:DUF7719 domain-containing protein n=2 Tax=Coemansia TaxID=4863 RepID=A0A9W8H5R8_9FUNG|nr:hypothetical protein GGI19_000302 [Coemansia pectinata]KAJ2863196.1 hypothetical protein GGH94_003781 [Coemansia aciculifera]KAJ2872850.1 hypothetical protein GGH93_003706 [Coemansia aciculifera]KAJ2874954.1 hypothetical protein H4R27_006448 [Coemansia aciculifera]
MVTISEDEHDDNVPLIKSLKELTSEPRSTGNPIAPKLEYPSASRIVRAGPNLDADGKPRYLIDEIPDNEKMRLIRESGIMNKYAKDKNRGTGSDVEEEDVLQYEDEEEQIPTWMDALIYTVALAAVYGLFEALVNQQYNVEVGFMELLQRMAKSAPAIYCIVFLTCRYRKMRVVNLLMLLASCASGCYFIHLNLHSPRLGIMRRAPGLVTLWIYLTFLMDVRPSIISAIVVGLFWMLDPFKANI